MPINPFVAVHIGGLSASAIYSGAVAPGLTAAPGAVAVGSDVLLLSGPGRLYGVVAHQGFLTLSGVQLNVYDGHAPVSGGPLYASGHLLIASLPAAYGVSGQLSAAGATIFPGGVPFNSGLCVNSRSGQTGCTFLFSRETSVNRSN